MGSDFQPLIRNKNSLKEKKATVQGSDSFGRENVKQVAFKKQYSNSTTNSVE